jgi:hypothetical protein
MFAFLSRRLARSLSRRDLSHLEVLEDRTNPAPSSMSRRSRIARVALALAALAMLASAFAWQCRQKPPDLSPWDEARLAEELEALGYHVRREACDREGSPGPAGHPHAVQAGLYACRQEPADWDAVCSTPRTYAKEWKGRVVAVRLRGPWLPAAPGDVQDHLVAGPWLFFGDEAELGRISRALGVSR